MSVSSGSEGANMTRNSHHVLHVPILALEWTAEEEKMLEEALSKYPPDKYMGLFRYMKVASLLPDKSTRDVALKIKWALQQKQQQQQQQQQPQPPPQPQPQETGKRRKAEEIPAPPPPPILTKKKEKKDKPVELKPAPLALPGPPLAMRPPMGTPVPMAMPMYCPPPINIEPEDSSCYQAIGGTAGKLLEQNDHLIAKCRYNFCGGKIQENIELLCQLRDNVTDVLNGMTSMPGIMSQMPPLPIKLNVDICDQILPKRLTPPVAAAPGGPIFQPPPSSGPPATTPTPPPASSKPSTSSSPPERTPLQQPPTTS